jgi:hypothetical protein
MVVPELTASQNEQAARLLRQAEAAQMVLNTAYRDQHGPSEAILCPACTDCAEFALTPDGRVVCQDCGMTIGRYGLRLDMVLP